MKTISQAEKTDILLALAMAFEKKNAVGNGRENVLSARELVETSFAALPSEDFEALKSRAALIDDLPSENRDAWRERRLEKARARVFEPSGRKP